MCHLNKDTDKNDIHAIHCILVVVDVHRLVRVHDDLTVKNTQVLEIKPRKPLQHETQVAQVSKQIMSNGLTYK